MNICVAGLWHLGTVTAACLASAGYRVAGFDFDEEVIRQLQEGQPPLFEPGLEELIKTGLQKETLFFTTDSLSALKNADILWIAYDTPVDEEDHADIAFVTKRIERLFPHIAEGTLLIISSQLPAGTTRLLEQTYANLFPDKPVSFACLPENLRLGSALSVFTSPDRVVAGIRSENDKKRLSELLHPFAERIEWMSVESAEMTKHAINSFLATSVAFINEVASLCEHVGADAKEVERGLKSEMRIGPKAYLSPGGAFAGGTLARDIRFLKNLAVFHNQQSPLLANVLISNELHKHWARNKLLSLFSSLKGIRVAVWGLTYKPGTDTLRRSLSIETCRWLVRKGAHVQAHDPAVKTLPSDIAKNVFLFDSELAALSGAAALVVATEWPEYQTVSADSVLETGATPLIVDPNRFLEKTLGKDPRLRYFTVGGV